MGIFLPLALIFLTCLVIWRACDGFERASEYIGRNLSEGVRGGTLNAISSSLPELFTTLIALFVLSDKDGFSVGIGTTAGSALFNGMIIPAACILTVLGTVVAGATVTSVNVSEKVILRDGLTLIICQLVLVVLINGHALYWWQGLVLMAMYGTYLAYMLLSMKPSGAGDADDADDGQETTASEGPRSLTASLFYWASGGPLLDLERFFIGEKQQRQIREKSWNGWPLLLTSATVIGAACYLLVIACEWLGTGPGNSQHKSYQLFGLTLQGIGMPTMFVAVIFAAMATSVPDTVMSIRDARDGDYDDAVANALGSNVFDICFALGFPLFIYTLIHGPIALSPGIAAQSAELRFLLLILTVVGFLIYFLGRRGQAEDNTRYIEMGSGKAYLLIGLYVLFVIYVVGLSNQADWAQHLSAKIQDLLQRLPTID